MMRSRSRWYSLRPRGDGSRCRRPRERSACAAYGASSGMLLRRAEHIRERGLRDVGRYESLADALEENEADTAALDLLVVAHQLEVALETQVGRLRRQSGGSEDRVHPPHLVLADQAEFLREPRRERHA